MELRQQDLYFVTGTKESLKYCDPNDRRLSEKERKKCIKMQAKEPWCNPNYRRY